MSKRTTIKCLAIAVLIMGTTSCGVPHIVGRSETRHTPASYSSLQDSSNTGKLPWRQYFTDPALVSLIDTALKNNQELNITLQEIEIARNEIRVRKGEYLPFLGLKAGAGVDRSAQYTLRGATEEHVQIEPEKENPKMIPDYLAAAYATWEIDIWHKLRNAKKAAVSRYLSTVEGKNFVVTQLIAEVANSYYELLALDNQLDIVKQNIDIQSHALEIVKLQKEATRVTELAVRKFEAEVLSTRSLQFGIRQRIVETENRINFLLGRFPQPIVRNDDAFHNAFPDAIHSGVPSQLLANRPDIRRAEMQLSAAKLDVKVARAKFYPSLGISATIGYQAFNPAYLAKMPESILFSLIGEMVAPVVNRNAIKAGYYTANAQQIQAAYNFERATLAAYNEVANQLSNINNLERSYDLKTKEVQALTQSIDISNDLFKSARADYMEVLLTQRDALRSKFELIETKKQQLNALVNIYQALGGGWN